MIVRARSYPHPVLAPFSDDVTPNQFEMELGTEADADNYYLNVSFQYENETISKLVSAGRAVHCVHVECRRNFYRKVFSLPESSAQLSVSVSELVGHVEVSGFVKSEVAIPEYRIQGAHADYGETCFAISAGDVLAIAPTQTFDAYTDYDPLRQISSILNIQKSESVEEGSATVDTASDVIVVTLSKSDFDRYTCLKSDPSLGPLLANQVIIPVLLEAIHEIQDASEENYEEGKLIRWYRSLDQKLRTLGIDLRNKEVPPIEAVQKLLELPFRRSFSGLLQITSKEDT